MERRGCNLGCIVALLALVLSCCLLPYLLSSIYSLVTAVFSLEAASKWLWGDWLSTLPMIGESEALYMLFAEGPICCIGALTLLLFMVGIVAAIITVPEAELYPAEAAELRSLEQEYMNEDGCPTDTYPREY